jgi:NAD(P)-dependent dehydrogenase (short-subunit alcohol dehydrogenase family)
VAERETVVVTGASSGVGRAIARAFAAEGARVALIARGREGLEGAARDVERAGGTALVLPTDVADAAAVEAAAAAAEDAFGRIDVWVNDAMTTVFAFFADIEPDEFRRATEVTYLGTVWGTRAALRRMVPRDRGVVIQVGSALAYRGIPLQAPYCGAKHAIKGFVESVRCELRHRGSSVHVGMVQLPALDTPQFERCRAKLPRHPMPVPPIYRPELAADAVVYAARRRRRELVVGLPTAYTIVGNKVAPWLVERYLARTGVDSQQTDEPIDLPRPGNLFDVLPGDPGAHGRFAARARSRSLQLLVAKHRGVAAGVAAALGLAAARSARR